jgi:hypothetical protein
MATIRWNNVNAPDQTGSIDLVGRAFDRIGKSVQGLGGIAEGVATDIKEQNTAQVKAFMQDQNDLTSFDNATNQYQGQSLLQQFGRGINTDAVNSARTGQRALLETQAKSDINEEIERAKVSGNFQGVDALLQRYSPVMQAEDVMGASTVAQQEMEASKWAQQIAMGNSEAVLKEASQSNNPNAAAALVNAQQRIDSATLVQSIPEIGAIEQKLRTGELTASQAMEQILAKHTDDPDFLVRNMDTLNRWSSSFANAQAEASNLNDVERAGLESFKQELDLEYKQLEAERDFNLKEINAKGEVLGPVWTLAGQYSNADVARSGAMFTKFLNEVFADDKEAERVVRDFRQNYPQYDDAAIHTMIDTLGQNVQGTGFFTFFKAENRKGMLAAAELAKQQIEKARGIQAEAETFKSRSDRRLAETQLNNIRAIDGAVSEFARGNRVGSGVNLAGVTGRFNDIRAIAAPPVAPTDTGITGTGTEDGKVETGSTVETDTQPRGYNLRDGLRIGSQMGAAGSLEEAFGRLNEEGAKLSPDDTTLGGKIGFTGGLALGGTYGMARRLLGTPELEEQLRRIEEVNETPRQRRARLEKESSNAQVQQTNERVKKAEKSLGNEATNVLRQLQATGITDLKQLDPVTRNGVMWELQQLTGNTYMTKELSKSVEEILSN